MTAPNTPAGDWEQAFAAYRRLRLLRDADVAFGPLAEATYNREIAIQQAETRCGSRREALAQRAVKAASRALFAAEERQAEHQALLADLGQSAEMAVFSALLCTMPLDRIEAVSTALDLFPGPFEAGALLQARAIIEAAAESRRAMERLTNLFGDQP